MAAKKRYILPPNVPVILLDNVASLCDKLCYYVV